jgi:gas vesicle protein
VRKPLLEGRDASGDSQNEWKGMLREMQKGVKKQIDALKQEQKIFNNTIENKIDQINKKITDDITKKIHDVV